MDILAARKKAAEKAKAVNDRTADPAVPAPEQHAQQSADSGFPPLPDTAFLPDEPTIRDQEAEPPQGAEAARTTQSEPFLPSQPAPAREQPMLQETPPVPTPAAESVPEEAAPEQALEMLSFLLGSEEYAVPVEQVREILTPQEITPVPHTAPYLLGVCSLRGTVMPVIDLNRRLGLAESLRDEKSRIVVVSLGHDDQVGLLVDRVRGVARFLPSSVRPAPETVAQGAGAEFLKGIARKDDRLYILLDIEKAVGA